MTIEPNATEHIWLIDSHVHLYRCFQPAEFLGAAYKNLHATANQLGYASNFSGLLLLTETGADEAFEQLRGRSGQPTDPTDPHWQGWRFDTIASDPGSLIAENPAGSRLWIIAGRQIITAEKLEVLALLTDSRFDDGQPLEKCLDMVRHHGAVPVLPWGAGKWWGERGRLLSRLLHRGMSTPFYLGDNGGRPGLWRHPRHFREALQARIRILPGSDPLPLSWEARRVGSRGFALSAAAEPTAPGHALRARLRDSTLQFQSFGKPLNSGHFILNQVALRMYKQHSARRMADA